MRHFLFLLLYGLADCSYNRFTPYTLDQTTVAIDDEYPARVSDFGPVTFLDCLASQNELGFAERIVGEDGKNTWAHRRLFSVLWFRHFQNGTLEPITSTDPSEPLSLESKSNSGRLRILVDQISRESYYVCRWTYTGHAMQSVSDSLQSWINPSSNNFDTYRGSYQNRKQLIWRSVPIQFTAKVLPTTPSIACYNGMTVLDLPESQAELVLEKCDSSLDQDGLTRLDVIYDTPFALDCVAEDGRFHYTDISWFFEEEPIVEQDSPYGPLLNVINKQYNLVMDGVHLVEGQLHFNHAKNGFNGKYHCTIGGVRSPTLVLSAVEKPDELPEKEVFNGRCFYPDAERQPFEVTVDEFPVTTYSLLRQRNVTLGEDLVFPKLCYTTVQSLRKQRINEDTASDSDMRNFWEANLDTLFDEQQHWIDYMINFYDSRAPDPLLGSDLLHTSIHHNIQLERFKPFVSQGRLVGGYRRPSARFGHIEKLNSITYIGESAQLTTEPVVMAQYRTNEEMLRYEKMIGDTKIDSINRKNFMLNGQGKYWNRNAIYDRITNNVTITCHVFGLDLDASSFVWFHDGEPLDASKFNSRVRRARKINSYSEVDQINRAKDELCASLEDESDKKQCREEQLLVSFIPNALQNKIPDWQREYPESLFEDEWETIPAYYWRLDLELTPDQARGVFQCQAGSEITGYRARTVIFFDRSDHDFTPAALSMSGQSWNDARNAEEWYPEPGKPFTFECRIDGLYRSDIERFQWDDDQTSVNGDATERQNSFPLPTFTKKEPGALTAHPLKINYGGLFAERTDIEHGFGGQGRRLEVPWEKSGIDIDDNPLVPAQKYHHYQYRPIVIRSPGHEQCAKERRSEKCDRYQVKYALSYDQMTSAEMGTYQCKLDYASSSFEMKPFDPRPPYNIEVLSAVVIPDPNFRVIQRNRKGVLIKWTLPLLDPCWRIEQDPGLSFENKTLLHGSNAERGFKSKEQFETQLREDCRIRSSNCKPDNPKCISLEQVSKVHYYMALIPHSDTPFRTIEISGINKRLIMKASVGDILNIRNETDCEHERACHIERGFSKRRCEGINDEKLRAECHLLVATGMMKVTCGCASFHEIVPDSARPSIRTSSGGEVDLEPSKDDANRRKLLRGTTYTVKIHAEIMEWSRDSERWQVVQNLHSNRPSFFTTPPLEPSEIHAPEIERILTTDDYATFHLRRSVLAKSLSGVVLRASVCWHELAELEKAQAEDIDPDGPLSPNAVHAYRSIEFDISQREVRVGPFPAQTKFMAYVEVSVRVEATGETLTDKSLTKHFEVDDFVAWPSLPLGVANFAMERQRGVMDYRWELPWVQHNHYVKMRTWDGVTNEEYLFNPGQATIEKRCDGKSSRKRPVCRQGYRYTKPEHINLTMTAERSVRAQVELFDFRRLQSRAEHAVYFNRRRSALEHTVLPPCSMTKGAWVAKNHVRLEWNCPQVAFTTALRNRAKFGRNVAQHLANQENFDDYLYFHIRWTYTGLWGQNDTGWYLPYKQVRFNGTMSGNGDEFYAYTVVQDDRLDNKKNFQKILNACQVLNFQVRLVLLPQVHDPMGRQPCFIESEDDIKHGSVKRQRTLRSDKIKLSERVVDCDLYAGSPFSDTLALQITPHEILPPPELEISFIKNDRLSLTTAKKLSHDCRQHYIQVQIRSKNDSRPQLPAVKVPAKETSDSNGDTDYVFPDYVYHSCYSLSTEKEETFRFNSFTQGQSGDVKTFGELCDKNAEYEISIRRGRGQNNAQASLNTCSNSRKGQHSLWTEWEPIIGRCGTSNESLFTSTTTVKPVPTMSSFPVTSATKKLTKTCWPKQYLSIDCDVDQLFIVIVVLIVLLLLMLFYICHKSNCWCQKHDNDCNGNLPILNNNSVMKYGKTEFTQRPPDFDNRQDESTGLLRNAETVNNELSNSTSELDRAPEMSPSNPTIHLPIPRSIQHRQQNLIKPSPQIHNCNQTKYEENVHLPTLPSENTKQISGNSESPQKQPLLPDRSTNPEPTSEETDSFPSSSSSLCSDPKDKFTETILAPSQVLAALETTT